MSDTTATTAAETAKPNDNAAGGKPQTPSETDWQAKFEAQQKVNRDLETRFNGLRDSQAQFTQGVAKALGLKPEETPTDVSVLAATVADLQSQFQQTQVENQVLAVAAAHGIKEPADIELLRSVKDEAAMRGIAARISAASGAPDNPSTSPGPRPDLTQGASGTTATGDPGAAFASFLGAQLGR